LRYLLQRAVEAGNPLQTAQTAQTVKAEQANLCRAAQQIQHSTGKICATTKALPIVLSDALVYFLLP